MTSYSKYKRYVIKVLFVMIHVIFLLILPVSSRKISARKYNMYNALVITIIHVISKGIL